MWHAFDKYPDNAVWPGVMPGDTVKASGTAAYRLTDFIDRTIDTRMLWLKGAPVLVLSVTPGLPDDPSTMLRLATAVVLSRHGLLVVVLERHWHPHR